MTVAESVVNPGQTVYGAVVVVNRLEGLVPTPERFLLGDYNKEHFIHLLATVIFHSKGKLCARIYPNSDAANEDPRVKAFRLGDAPMTEDTPAIRMLSEFAEKLLSRNLDRATTEEIAYPGNVSEDPKCYSDFAEIYRKFRDVPVWSEGFRWVNPPSHSM